MSVPSLEEFERRARELAEHAPGGAFTTEALQEALDSSPRQALPMEPAVARREEMGYLVSALVHERRVMASVGEYPMRAGYLLESPPGAQTVRVRPAFAESLAAQVEPLAALRTLSPDLWKAGLTHMAAGVLDRLSDAEAQEAVDLARHARADWRHRVLEGLGEAAERLRRDVAWHAAVDGLLEVIHQDTLDAQERVRAALLALRRVSSRPLGHPDRATYLQKLADVASRPPFQQNIALKRELRRLGVSSLA